MPLYALRRTSDNQIIKLQNFTVAPSVLAPSKNAQWELFIPPIVGPTPEQILEEAERQRLATDRTSVLAYAKLQSLANLSPSQIQNFIDTSVTNLATAQDAIKTLAIGLGYLFRKEKVTRGL